MSEDARRLAWSFLARARDDLALVEFVIRQEEGLLGPAIFHCQQAAEKAIKAILAFHGQEPPKTHDLGVVIALAVRFAPELAAWERAATQLTPYATRFRYPGVDEAPTRDEFARAFRTAKEIYQLVLSQLPEDTHP